MQRPGFLSRLGSVEAPTFVSALSLAVVVPLRPSRDVRSDEALVRATLSGARGSFEELYRRHARMATGMAHRLLGGGHEVDDVVQDAFVTALSKLDSLRDPQAFARWLGTIVVHAARRRLRRRSLKARLLPGLRESVDLDALIGAATPPDVALELRALYGALDSLGPEVAIALVLRRVEGMTIPEMAEAMNLSPATVKRRLKTGEERLGFSAEDAS